MKHDVLTTLSQFITQLTVIIIQQWCAGPLEDHLELLKQGSMQK